MARCLDSRISSRIVAWCDPSIVDDSNSANVIKEESMNTLWQDLRYGVRVMAKKPGLTFIAALSLALGIGANTSMFSVVNALFFRQLPVPEPDRLMFVFNGSRNNPLAAGSFSELIYFPDPNASFPVF